MLNSELELTLPLDSSRCDNERQKGFKNIASQQYAWKQALVGH